MINRKFALWCENEIVEVVSITLTNVKSPIPCYGLMKNYIANKYRDIVVEYKTPRVCDLRDNKILELEYTAN